MRSEAAVLSSHSQSHRLHPSSPEFSLLNDQSQLPSSPMHPSPHPSQVRSACERCRRQKLRCSRQLDAEASCARCARLGLVCESGSQRRIGRPPRRDVVLRKPSGGDRVVRGPSEVPDGSAQDIVPLPPTCLLDDDVHSMGWMMESPLPLSFGGADMMLSLDPFPPLKEIRPPCVSPELALSANSHFETLSRLNVEIRKGYDGMARLSTKITFEEFIIHDNGIGTGWKNVQTVVKCAQEFLVVIKSLHRQMGAHDTAGLRQDGDTSQVLSLTMDPALSTEPPDKPMDPGPETLPTHDSPTIFLVISCYVQLIKHLELIFNLINARIAHSPHLCPGPMAFADVAIIEGSSQFIMFCELVGHILCQINLVLGPPSGWSGRTAWTGLLRVQRYREMVNAELGGEEEGGWTRRPRKLMQTTRATKELIIEFSMVGG